MADDPTNSNPASNNQASSTGEPNKDQKGTSQDKNQADAVALAEKVGKLEAENANLKKYQDQVNPVIQTIWSNEELLKKTTEIHNKRLGITPDDDKEIKKDDKIATAPSATELDNRNALIKTIVDGFSKEKGIDKLEKEKKEEINARVGVELKEMLDPMGNKTLQQIMETVSATKLPHFLEKAYFLATRNETIETAKAEGKRAAADESAGIIGSIPSSSITPDQVGLSAQEKEIARKQGVSEEKYLENKKEILKSKGQLF